VTEPTKTAERVLQLAKQHAVDQVEVFISGDQGFSVTACHGDVETIEHSDENSLSVTVYKDQRSGSASTTDLSPEAISRTVDKAYAFSCHAGADPCAGLADPHRLAKELPDLSLCHPWKINPSEAIEMAIHCEAVGREQDQRIIQSEGVSVSSGESYRLYANSHGFMASYPTSYHSISCGLIAKDHGEMQRDYEYTAARDATDLDDVALVAKHAAEKTLLRLGARKIKTRRCPVIFHSAIAKSLLRHFISAISGGNLYRRSSFLLDALGKSVFPEHIRLYQQPHLLKGMGSAPFDSEGVLTEARDYVTDGILNSYILNSYSARQLGMETTGNAGGVYNLRVSHSDHNLKALFKSMGSGFFVTELIGQGVSILTGDYSRGAAGFWIEHGEIQHAVHEVTISGHLQDIFKNIIAVGNDVDTRGNTQTGSIWVDNMTVAGS
jgi:PmbA protein